jgi:DNA polymerase/3'-5' exonuclease PolX
MNNKIIKEFERLIDYIKENINIDNKDIYRIKNLKNVLSILKKYPIKITIDNYYILIDINGIGKGTIDRIKEILDYGSLTELGKFKIIDKNKNNIINDLLSIVGIGPIKAEELYNKGIKSIIDLKNKVKLKKIKLNDKLLLGLKYHNRFFGNIPRKETDKIYNIIKLIINKINKKYNDNEKFIFEICGSYRRGNKTSGDIDVLISKKGELDKHINYLENIVLLLKNPIEKNNNKPLIIDDITNRQFHTKYMGFCKYINNDTRRIDIRFVDYKYWYSSLVYFTGSMQLNKNMRNIAKTKNLKLSEYGLEKKDGTKILINSEKEIFDILDIKYLEPFERNI